MPEAPELSRPIRARRRARPTVPPPDSVSLPPADEPDDGLPRRERKRREVRDRLYRAAVSLFTEQGFEATTMDAIAERADVARATVFNYFSQKVAFLEEWGLRRRAHVARAMAANDLADHPVTEQLRCYFQELATLNLASRPQTAILMDASWRFGGLLRDPGPGRLLSQIVEAGVRQGEVRPDVDPALAGQILSTAYFSTVLRWIESEPPPFSLTEQLDKMLDIVLRGLLVHEPAKLT
jgi:AcrR family transcriptional regulator